ncbi:hypothetical protein LCI18_009821 [Fusarium solani-melongenae]|uniref:Uncharacterized protein n=1 Tax=Fusarium solani subsp. cucurbitae TaxID=2747967 RepID=A0ACD3ZDG7_FUSSC|nr:hypothetical protein LCI18_009821 [Fusarium solani-melongenae]
MAKDDEEPKKKADLEELSQLLDVKDRVKAKDATGGTALHLAAEKGLVEAVTKLIGAEAKVSGTNNEGRQPLHKACSEGHLDIVNLLVKNGANTQITQKDGWSPLHSASRYGHTKVIQALLKEDKTNIDATESLAGWTALNAAIYHGHGDAVSALLEQKADVGIQDNDGWTPLMTAIKQKHEDIVKKLLDQEGALGLETRDESGDTPLLTASVNGFVVGASLLINAGADCNALAGSPEATPLISASCWGYREIDEDEWAPMHYASNRGYSKVVVLLLQHGANFELVNNDGQIALHLASKNGNEDVVKLLLDAKAKADARGQDGATALHLASGARPEDRCKQYDDEIGTDALSAIEREREESRSGQHATVVELLLKHEAKPGTRTNKDETALHLAAARGDPARLGRILNMMEQEHMSIGNDQGRTALYLACTGDNPESAVESLLKSDKLMTAEFGRRDGEDDEIKWAANYPETHGIAKWLMEERLRRKETAQPAGSAKWSMIDQLPEVLSSLIAQSPGGSDTRVALKYALKSKLESTFQSVHELRQDAEQSKFCKVLKLLVADVLPTPTPKTALKFVLDVTLDLALGTRVNQGAGHKQLLQVLSLLTDSFSGTPEIKDKLRSAFQLAKKAENQQQGPEQESIAQKKSKDEAGISSQKGKEKGPDKTKNRREKSAQAALPAKEPETDYLLALMDILRDPPFSQTHKDVRIDGPPKHDPKLSKILRNLEATIVQFYKSEGESETFRRYRSLKEVIYDHGPGSIMENTISDLRKVLWERSKVPDSLTYLETKPKFTWVHLPATNVSGPWLVYAWVEEGVPGRSSGVHFERPQRDGYQCLEDTVCYKSAPGSLNK